MIKTRKQMKILIHSFAHFDWSRFLIKNMDRRKLSWAVRSMIHPVSEYRAIKYEGHGSVMLANSICLLTFVVSCMEYFLEGFVFNYRQPDSFNLLVTLLSSSLFLLLWNISGWCVCSLLDGEGSFKESWIVTCYAMLPRVIYSPVLILVSNFLTVEESALYHAVSKIIILWSAVLILVGMMIIQQYTFKKTVGAVLLTVAGIAIILFIGILFTSMFQQFCDFIKTVFRELFNRC